MFHCVYDVLAALVAAAFLLYAASVVVVGPVQRRADRVSV